MAPRARPTLSAIELGEALGVTRQAVQKWKDRGCPHQLVKGVARYVLAEVVEWRLAEAAAAARNATTPDEATERAGKLRAERELKELELAERRGALVPKADARESYEAFVGGLAAVAAGRLQRFERDMVAAADAGAARRITQRIHAALMEGAQDYAAQLEAEAEALDAAADGDGDEREDAA